MHDYDPNGQLKGYRRERDRDDLFIMLGIGALCAVTFVCLAWMLITHYR